MTTCPRDAACELSTLLTKLNPYISFLSLVCTTGVHPRILHIIEKDPSTELYSHILFFFF